MKYVGFCYDSGGWGGDLTGMLLVEKDGGWLQAGSHLSSSDGWAQIDIQRHYDQRTEQLPGDTYEWAGRITADEAMQRFPAGADPDGANAVEQSV